MQQHEWTWRALCCEISQTETDKYLYDTIYLWNLKNTTKECNKKGRRLRYREQTHGYQCGEKWQHRDGRKWKWKSVMSDSLQLLGLYSPWNSPGQNTGVGIRSLLQGIFPSLGSNPGLPCYQQILYQLSHQGSPRIPAYVAYHLLQGIFLI